MVQLLVFVAVIVGGMASFEFFGLGGGIILCGSFFVLLLAGQKVVHRYIANPDHIYDAERRGRERF